MLTLLPAEGTEAESDVDVEKVFDESTGKKRNYNGYHTYRVVKECTTEPNALLEDAEILYELEITPR